MPTHRMNPVLAGLLFYLAGCLPAAWTPAPVPERADTMQVMTGKVRVIRTIGDTLTGDGLSIRGDSAWLVVRAKGYRYIPRAEILELGRDRTEGRKDAATGLVFGVVVVTAIFVYVIVDGFKFRCTEDPC